MTAAMAAKAVRRGAVTAFDEPRGLGEVTGEDGDVLGFHCTAIADGSRTVDVGAKVAYQVTPGLLGRFEARDLVKL